MTSPLQEHFKAPIVLVVDDTPEILSQIYALLRGVYQVKSATHGSKCLQIAQSEPQPDLILLGARATEVFQQALPRRLAAQTGLGCGEHVYQGMRRW